MKLKISTLIYIVILFFISWCTSSWWENKNSQVSVTKEQTIQQRIFVLWDSLSAWYQLPYEDSYPAQLENLLHNQWYNIKVINGWESWDTSSWLKLRINRVTADAQTWDIALIVIWWNDGLQWLSTDELKKNINDITIILQSRWLKTIIWWMQIPTNLWESYRSDFAAIYPIVANDTKSLLIPFILSWVAWVPELNLRDGIHPNISWQAIIAKTVFDILLQNNLVQ